MYADGVGMCADDSAHLATATAELGVAAKLATTTSAIVKATSVHSARW